MNREQTVDKAADTLVERCYGAYLPEAPLDLARAVVDAILPQVTTVAELQALHPKALLLRADGQTYHADMGGAYWCIQDGGALTVVWTPEEQS